MGNVENRPENVYSGQLHTTSETLQSTEDILRKQIKDLKDQIKQEKQSAEDFKGRGSYNKNMESSRVTKKD